MSGGEIEAMIGVGGGPTRATTLPADAAGRKTFPMATGLLDYFPDALAAVAHLSWRGNQQHNPDQPLHWNRAKSGDEADTMIRHMMQRGTRDTDGQRHSTKVAWRALAMLQKEIEAEQARDADTPTMAVLEGRDVAKPPLVCHGSEKDTHPLCAVCREKGVCVNAPQEDRS